MKYRISVLVLLTSVLIYIGCKDNFLETRPQEAVAADSFFQNESDAIAGINAVYASLQNRQLYSEFYPKTVEGASDDMLLNNTSHLALTNYTWTATLSTFDDHWQGLYEGIFRANMVLQNVPDIDMDQGLKDRILGEARFLRALDYWHLMALFGEVPIILEATPNNPFEAAKPKTSSPEIISQMVTDLEAAIDLLPRREEYGSENLGRATEGAARALLGKVHLYSASPIFGGNQEGYALAAEQFEQIINNYSYELVDFEDLWVVDNNAENIFEVQYTDVGGSIWAVQDNAGANETNLRAALNNPIGHGGNGNLVPTQELVDEFGSYSGPDPQDIFDNRDPRLYYTVWRQGDYFDSQEPTYQAEWSPINGYSLKKGLFPFTDRAEDGTERNIPVIRYGDVLLMYAEAVNAKGNREPQEAIDAINEIRDRVNMPTYPNSNSPYSVNTNSSEQEIFEAIVHERRVELAGEYVRYHDLRRWELAEEEMGDVGWQHPKHTFFPIPAEEIENNDQLEQNSNY